MRAKLFSQVFFDFSWTLGFISPHFMDKDVEGHHLSNLGLTPQLVAVLGFEPEHVA